jgi:hypothetical protein
MKKMQNDGKNKSQKIEICRKDRAFINGAKEIALDNLRILPKIHTTETFDYDRAWRNYVYVTLSGKVDSEVINHITKTEKKDWIQDLKELQEYHQEKKDKGWLR